jgi:predicted metalloprotease
VQRAGGGPLNAAYQRLKMIARRTRLGPALAVVVAAALTVLIAVAIDTRDSESGFGGVTSGFDEFPESTVGYGPGRTVPQAPDVQRDLVAFVGFVVNDVQAFWRDEFSDAGRRYEPATLVIFRRATVSGCGLASSATGPFYCPVDQRVYLDLMFFRELAVEFRAPGDFAQAYVIAHEVAHHVQTLAGVTQQVDAASVRDPAIANELSIRLELQADCLAGVWAHSTYERGLLERGDLEEALNAAAAVGDDRIQRHTTGRINPETWTHGSSAQRARWLLRGFESGDAAACQTFAARV